VRLEATLGNNRATGSFPEFQGNNGNTTSASLGVRLAMPLYSGGSIDNRIRETVSLQEQARNNLEAARRGVAQSTRQAFFGVQSGQAQVRALEAAESSSKLALEATQLGYRVGVRVNLDVLNAQTQLFTTQRDLSRARYDVVVNGLRLRQAAGTLQPSDVSAVNALLAR
jgi:outer membrane protein